MPWRLFFLFFSDNYSELELLSTAEKQPLLSRNFIK